MNRIYANRTVSISELKKSPSSVIEHADGEAVAILNHNKPSAYIVPSMLYEKMAEILDDYLLKMEAEERIEDGELPVRVDIDAL